MYYYSKYLPLVIPNYLIKRPLTVNDVEDGTSFDENFDG